MIKWFIILIFGLPVVLYNQIFLSYMTKHKDKYSLQKRYDLVRKTVKWILFLTRRKGNIIGKEIVTTYHEQGRVYISNHFSKFDSMEMIELSEKPLIILSKYENIKAPILSTYIKAIDGIFVDRTDLKQSLRLCAKACDLAINGADILVYAEGTRSKDGKIGSFKGAASYILKYAKSEVVLVCTHNTLNPLSFRWITYPKEKFNLMFFEPISYDEYLQNRKSFLDNARETLIRQLENFRKEYGESKKWKTSSKHNSK